MALPTTENDDDPSPRVSETPSDPPTGTANGVNGTANGATHGIAAGTTNGQSSHRERQKRARSQLSCTPCRQGKLKCNRQHDPACDQCIKRNRESACIYLPPPVKHKAPQNVKGRIRQLEDLVVDLMNQNRSAQKGSGQTSTSREEPAEDVGSRRLSSDRFSHPTPPSDTDSSLPSRIVSRNQEESPPTDVDAATRPFGQMKISKDEIRYVGDAHWGAILNSISDLKRDFEDDDGDEGQDDEEPEMMPKFWKGNDGVLVPGQPQLTSDGLGFMFGAAKPITREQLIKSVPEKRVADRLLSLWFNSPDPFKPVIHAPTFQDEYRRFWRNPEETPTMWFGLLFAIMSLAASFGLRDAEPTSAHARAVIADVHNYQSLSASAAVLADFTKPKPHTLECLILYAAGLRSSNAFVNVWLIIGLVVRLALRMGYHRDASHYAAITPFEGEMRRRSWAMISMIDVLISFHVGLPSMVKTIQSDSQPPRNLLDRDFNVATKELPPSRGIHELTPCSYTRAKLEIVRVFGIAAEMSHATIPPSYEEVIQMDRELEEAKAAVPPLLQMPDISELVTDPAEQLMCRFNLDMLYLKTKMVLHRRFMLTPTSQLSAAEQERGVGDSRKACTECGLRVLQHHQTIYTATQPGGQLESVKWYMGSISTHDFLLAAMIICLELSYQIKDRSFATNPRTGIGCPKRRELMEALEASEKIWSSAREGRSKIAPTACSNDVHQGEQLWDETDKASRAMATMVQKVKRQFGAHAGQTPQPYRREPSPMNTQPSSGTSLAQPEQIDAFNLANQSLDFRGVIPHNDWADLNGVDNQLLDPTMTSFGNTGAPQAGFNTSPSFGNSTDGMSQMPSTTYNTPSLNGSLNTTDFAMVGDMLDVPVTFDWTMWDQEINNDNGGAGDTGAALDGFSTSATTMPYSDAFFNSRIGNTMVGGTGPGPANMYGVVDGFDFPDVDMRSNVYESYEI